MAFCSSTDIADILSDDGMLAATDDSREELLADATRVSNAIERAEQRIKQFVGRKYSDVQLDGNTWVKWACATIAAFELMRRRGNTPPDGLRESYDEIVGHLKNVSANASEIPDAIPRQEPGVAMTNLRYDPRYPVSKIRAVTQISAGNQNSVKPRRRDFTHHRDY